MAFPLDWTPHDSDRTRSESADSESRPTTLEDIMTALDQIESDYEGNCRAAREIAEQYFAADKVLDSLMTRAGL